MRWWQPSRFCGADRRPPRLFRADWVRLYAVHRALPRRMHRALPHRTLRSRPWQSGIDKKYIHKTATARRIYRARPRRVHPTRSHTMRRAPLHKVHRAMPDRMSGTPAPHPHGRPSNPPAAISQAGPRTALTWARLYAVHRALPHQVPLSGAYDARDRRSGWCTGRASARSLAGRRREDAQPSCTQANDQQGNPIYGVGAVCVQSLGHAAMISWWG